MNYLPRRRRWRTKHETKENVPKEKTLGMLSQMPETNHTHPPPPLLQPSPISPICWKTRPRVQRVILMLYYSISVFSRHCAVLVRRTDKHKKRSNKQTQQDTKTDNTTERHSSLQQWLQQDDMVASLEDEGGKKPVEKGKRHSPCRCKIDLSVQRCLHLLNLFFWYHNNNNNSNNRERERVPCVERWSNPKNVQVMWTR